MGGRGSGLSHPRLLMSVWTVPLQAGKSQTQRSDIWEALGSLGIFRRPDMPRILGVAEPEKQGGQQKANQKKWPEPRHCPYQGRLALPFPRPAVCKLDLLIGTGSCCLLGIQVQTYDMPWGHSVQCTCSPLICSGSYLVLALVQMSYWAPGSYKRTELSSNRLRVMVK